MSLKLYSYFRSSCSYRVRIVLALKGIGYETIPVHLVRDGGEQHQEAYKSLNPLSQVPYLVLGNGVGISQSVAIVEYLEEAYPDPALLPSDPEVRARVREIVELINSGIQPIQNLSVMKYLKSEYGQSDESVHAWNAHWITRGFEALEFRLKQSAGRFCYRDEVTLADAFLVPQVFNAKRFNVDLTRFPAIDRVHRHCEELEAFQMAHPSQQPDSE